MVRMKEEIIKKQPQMKKKKCSFAKTIHCVTSWWQNYMNFTSNCFCTHRQCLQTSKERSREKDLAPMKKWYRKVRCILKRKKNCSTKKASNCQRNVGISVSPKKETMLMNEVEFCQKVLVLIVKPETYWVMCFIYIYIYI